MSNQKVIEYIEFKKNPSLAFFMAVQQMRADLERMKGEMRDELKKEIIEKLEIKIAEANPSMERMVRNILSDIKGEKGEKGDMPQKGADYWTPQEIEEVAMDIQSRIRVPKDGRNGKDGFNPKAGIDFPTIEQTRKMVADMVVSIKIKDGLTPKKGIDYFTENDISQIMARIKVEFPKIEINAIEIRNKLQSLQGEDRLDASALKNLESVLKKIGVSGGKRMLRGGGVDLAWEVPSGSLNGSNVTFTIENNPYNAGMVMVFVNGQLMKRNTAGQTDNDYSISAKTITLNTAPPSGSVIFAFYRK